MKRPPEGQGIILCIGGAPGLQKILAMGPGAKVVRVPDLATAQRILRVGRVRKVLVDLASLLAGPRRGPAGGVSGERGHAVEASKGALGRLR